jgi:predicted N-acyltransferase
MPEMRATVCDGLGNVDREAWAALDRPSFYLSYDWLAARSETVGGRFHVVLVHDDVGRLLVGVPCYVTDETSHPGYDPVRVLTDGDDESLQASCDRLRPALVVAAPGRAGGIAVAPGLGQRERARALAVAIDAAEGLAVREGVPVVAWLYVAEGADAQLDALLSARSYLRSVVEAECYLPIAWSSFDDYLEHFKAPRRGKIRREKESLIRAGGQIEMGGHELLGLELARLEVQWRHKYGRDASLPDIERQYDLLRRHLGSMIRVFVARRDGVPIGFSVFFEDENVWYVRFVGFDYAVDRAFLYFNLLFYAPIQAAITRRIACIRYSFKSYDAKRSRGCLLENVLAYVRVPELVEPCVHAYLAAFDQRRRATLSSIAASHTKASASGE